MNNDKEQITSNEKSEDVLADLSKDEHSGEETSSPESSGKGKKTFTDTDGSDSVNADVAAKPSILRRIILIAAICVFCYSSFGEVYTRPIFPIRNSSSFSCSMLVTLGNGWLFRADWLIGIIWKLGRHCVVIRSPGRMNFCRIFI